ncbi:MAG: rod shape-determining protein MreD [Pseudomonadota bacterium]
MIVFLYSVYEPNALSAPVVFALGLLHDLLYGGSFGLWASVYLAMQYLVYTQREYLNGRVGRVIWLAFALATLSVITLYWLEQSLLGGRWMPLMPLVTQTVLTILLYPAASFLFFSLKIRAAAQRAERGEAG